MRTSPRGRLALLPCALFLTLSLAACDKPIDPSAQGTATHAGTARLYLVDEEWPCPTSAEAIDTKLCAEQRRYVPLVDKRELTEFMKQNLVKSNDHFLIRLNSAFIKYIKKAGLFTDKGRLIVVAAFESTNKGSSLHNSTESYVVFGSEGQTVGSFLDFDDWPMLGPVKIPSGDLLLRLVIINSVQKEKSDLKKAVDMVTSLTGSANPSTTMAMKVANPIATLLINLLSDQVIFDYRFALHQSSGTSRSYANELHYGTYALVQQEDVLIEDDINKHAPQAGYVPNVGEMRFDLKSHRLYRMYTFNDQPDLTAGSSSAVALGPGTVRNKAAWHSISTFDMVCGKPDIPALPTRSSYFPSLYNDPTLQKITVARRMATLRRAIATIKNMMLPSDEDKALLNASIAEFSTMDKQASALSPAELNKKECNQTAKDAKALTANLQCILTQAELGLLNAEANEANATCAGYAEATDFKTCEPPANKSNHKNLSEERSKAAKTLLELKNMYATHLGQAVIGVGPGSEGPILKHSSVNVALQRMFYESSRSADARKMSIRYFERSGKPAGNSSNAEDCKDDKYVKRHSLQFPTFYYPQYNTLLMQYGLHTNMIFSVEQVDTTPEEIEVRSKTFSTFYNQQMMSGKKATATDGYYMMSKVSEELTKYRDTIRLLDSVAGKNAKAKILSDMLCKDKAANYKPTDETELDLATAYLRRVEFITQKPMPDCGAITTWISNNP